jgi:hypothetical protein
MLTKGGTPQIRANSDFKSFLRLGSWDDKTTSELEYLSERQQRYAQSLGGSGIDQLIGTPQISASRWRLPCLIDQYVGLCKTLYYRYLDAIL